jgi:hypothetical protein
VDRIQGVRQLDPQLQDLLVLEGPGGDPMLQRLAFQQLHADEGPPLVRVDVVDRADVGVVEGRGRAGLALEALEGLVAREQPLRQKLERHPTAETGVLGLVDDAHPAAAQLLEDAVVRDRLADHGVATPRRPSVASRAVPSLDSTFRELLEGGQIDDRGLTGG